MRNKKGNSSTRFLLILFILSLYALGLLTAYRLFRGFNPFTTIKDYAKNQKRLQIESLIRSEYYKDVESSVLNDGVYKGLVSSLEDPYSTYFTADEYKKFMEDTSGKYAGIGAVLSKDPDTGVVSVKEVFPESPAAEAGIIEGDTIVSADGNLAKTMDLSLFVTHLRGEEGTSVSVIYERDGEEFHVDIERRIISTTSVYYNMVDENTGYLQITEFQESTETEFKNAISELEASGMENIIYDLRGNPGGYVASVTAILDDMLPEGIVVYTETKDGKRVDYKSDEEHKLDYPCIVLVDSGTASSSEIFSGAVRDFNYGQLLGTTTYGKGVVQSTYTLNDGSAVKLTIAQYFTPKGYSIHETGLTPDIEMEYEFLGPEGAEYSQEYDNQIQKALELLD